MTYPFINHLYGDSRFKIWDEINGQHTLIFILDNDKQIEYVFCYLNNKSYYFSATVDGYEYAIINPDKSEETIMCQINTHLQNQDIKLAACLFFNLRILRKRNVISPVLNNRQYKIYEDI